MPLQPIPARGSLDPWEAFYRPAYEISIATGEELPGKEPDSHAAPKSVLHDIEAVSYVDNVEEADSFSMTITNWDADLRRLKYIGYPQKPKDDAMASFFDVGKKFLIRLGYQGNLREMMVGYVSNVEASFPQSGAPTLKVAALDVLARRRQRRFTWRWENKTDSQIAKELSRLPDQPRGRPGLGVTIKTNPVKDEAVHPRVAMRDQTVPAFLMERARLHAYSVFRTVDAGKPVLYFGPSEELTLGPYTLEWGKTLLDFTPTMKIAGQARSAKVRTSNRGGSSRLEGKAELKDFKLNADLHSYLKELGEDKEVPDRALRTKGEAQELASATVRAALKGLVEVTGTTIGLPDLRAGQVIRITGVDYRYDGRYFVTQTTHTIDTGGYKTSFRARREEVGRT